MPTDRVRLMKALKALVASFPNTTMNEQNYEIYSSRLSELPILLVEQAILKAIDTCDFLPSIAKIKSLVAEEIVGDTAKAHEQAAVVLRMIQDVGQYRPQPQFLDPITDKIVTDLGWKTLCVSSPAFVTENVSMHYATLRKRALTAVQTGAAPTVGAAINAGPLSRLPALAKEIPEA